MRLNTFGGSLLFTTVREKKKKEEKFPPNEFSDMSTQNLSNKSISDGVAPPSKHDGT
jgi:hypothetical protein